MSLQQLATFEVGPMVKHFNRANRVRRNVMKAAFAEGFVGPSSCTYLGTPLERGMDARHCMTLWRFNWALDLCWAHWTRREMLKLTFINVRSGVFMFAGGSHEVPLGLGANNAKAAFRQVAEVLRAEDATAEAAHARRALTELETDT